MLQGCGFKSVLKKYAKSNQLNTKHRTVTFSKLNEISNNINTVANTEAPPLTISQQIRDKCNESGCWIFIKSIDDLKHCI